MKVVHVILVEAIQNFLNETPVALLANSFENGVLTGKTTVFAKNHFPRVGALIMGKDKNGFHGVFRTHENDVVPNIIRRATEHKGLEGVVDFDYKGKSYEVKIRHNTYTGHIECSSPLFDELIELAKVRSEK